MTVSDFSESELVARIQARLQPAPEWLAVGIGDDAAVVETERNRLEVLTVDALVDGVHFDRRYTPPDAIGHRALAVNLSDLAAMGASPRLALVSFVLPSDLPCGDFDEMASGLAALAVRHRLHVIGGNLARSNGPLMVDVTVIGTVKPRQTMRREGARPGDEIYVTGAIGQASAGLQILQQSDDLLDTANLECVQRFLYPQPRLRVGTLLSRNRAASACMDLSDGLADGLRQIAQASGVGMTIQADSLPIAPGAASWLRARSGDPVAASLASDDYELVFTVKPSKRRRMLAATAGSRVKITRIGVCTAERDLVLERLEPRATSHEPPAPSAQSPAPSPQRPAPSREPLPEGYSHFRRPSAHQ